MPSEVWLLCLTSERTVFPNLSVLGVCTTKDKALELLSTLPKQNTYIMYRAPLDQFFGFYKRTGELKDGMGQLYHEHFEPVEP